MKLLNQVCQQKSVHILLFISLLLVAGCSDTSTQNKQGAELATQGMPIQKVSTTIISKGDQKLHFEYPARVRSIGSVDVYAKVAGTLIEQFYKEGEFIQKDTPLFKIDPEVYQAAYNEALAALDVQKASLSQAERNWERSRTLFEQKALSQKERDDALAMYETANASVANAEATLAKAALNLDYTTITAPISGMSGVKLHDIGSYVGGTSGSAIVTSITQIAPIHIEFSVADSQVISALSEIKSGKIITQEQLAVQILDRQGNVLDKGIIDFIDSRIDETIGSIKVRAVSENNDSNLLPGQFVRVVVDGVSIPNAAIIPQQAVLQTAQGTFIYLLKEGRAKITPINIEQSLAKYFIVTGVFEDGDELILDNLLKLTLDAEVQADDGSK